MNGRPVLYLDLDDTLLSWATGKPIAAPGAREFVLWAAQRYEIRWLTRWCPDGRMQSHLLDSLCRMLCLDAEVLEPVRGLSWLEGGSKLDGIAWLEHLVLGRPFLWLEDDKGVGEPELRFLARHGLQGAYRHCNVTRDPGALERIRAELEWDHRHAADQAAA